MQPSRVEKKIVIDKKSSPPPIPLEAPLVILWDVKEGVKLILIWYMWRVRKRHVTPPISVIKMVLPGKNYPPESQNSRDIEPMLAQYWHEAQPLHQVPCAWYSQWFESDLSPLT